MGSELFLRFLREKLSLTREREREKVSSRDVQYLSGVCVWGLS
jgi:hypothetical protein